MARVLNMHIHHCDVKMASLSIFWKCGVAQNTVCWSWDCCGAHSPTKKTSKQKKEKVKAGMLIKPIT